MNKIIFLILFIAQTIVLTAQQKKVGVVLSGGGARGLAHVGFLKALEENNIPIDYISGTSIGAIVGGLYSIGYSPEDLSSLLGSEEFLRWSLGVIDPEKEYYYKVKDNRPGWVSINFIDQQGLLKPQLPTNLISPAQMDLRFLQFMAPAAAGANYNFDSLMIPFFCVSADVYHKKPVIFRNGNLPAAIRSSMTFPGYFKPIVVDSALLFDGGMENNFPADLMDSIFRPDVIIGSKVASNPKRPDPDDLFRQLENIFMKPSDYSVPKNGIIIEPNVEKYDLMDFAQFTDLYQEGYSKTIEKMDSIKMLVTWKISNENLLQKRNAFKAKQKSLLIKNIFIRGVSEQVANFIMKNIFRNRETLSFEEFETEYFKLLSDKLVSSIYPEVFYNSESGYYDLYMDIKTKNDLSVTLGGNVASNLRGIGFTGIDYIYQKKNTYSWNANIWAGNFYSAFNGSLRIDFPPRNANSGRLITPFYTRFSATIQRYDYFTATNDWFVDDAYTARLKQDDRYLDIQLGRPIGNRSILSTGFVFGQSDDYYYNTPNISRNDTADRTQFAYNSLHTTFEYNTLNQKQYATKGIQFFIRGRFINGQEQYIAGSTTPSNSPREIIQGHGWLWLNAEIESYRIKHKWITLGLHGQVQLSNQSLFSNGMSSLVSAKGYTPFPQSKVHFLQTYKSNNFISVGVEPIIRFNDIMHFRTGLYMFQPHQYIKNNSFTPAYSKVWPTPNFMANSALVIHTPAGPIAFTGSYFHKEARKFYFQVNFGYILYSPKGLD